MRLASIGLAALTLVFSACDSGSSAPASVRYTVDGPAAVTFTGSDGSSHASTLSAAWQTDVSIAAGTPVVLSATSTTGAPVTASIYVDDVLASSRRGSSVRVESTSDDRGSHEAEVRGTIEAVAADRVTVTGRVFVIDSGTRLLDDNNNPVSLGTFVVGTYVEAEGRPLGDGTFRATKIKVEDESGDDDGSNGTEIEVHGTISAIDAEAFTVGGRRFVTSASTRYLDDRNTAVARSSFGVGELVEAEGHARSDGSVQAEKIKRDDH